MRVRRWAWLGAVFFALAGCGPREVYEKHDLGDGSYEILSPHGRFRYLSAETAKEAGIGIRIGLGQDSRIVVLEVFPGSPAQAAGLAVGDRFLKLDGRSLAGHEPAQAAARIRGRPGSTMKLSIERMKKPLEVELSRADKVMRFTEFPEGLLIRHFAKKDFSDSDCPLQKKPDCHFLVDAGDTCFYSCRP